MNLENHRNFHWTVWNKAKSINNKMNIKAFVQRNANFISEIFHDVFKKDLSY